MKTFVCWMMSDRVIRTFLRWMTVASIVHFVFGALSFAVLLTHEGNATHFRGGVLFVVLGIVGLRVCWRIRRWVRTRQISTLAT